MCDCQMHCDWSMTSLVQKQLLYSEGCIQEKEELCILVVWC